MVRKRLKINKRMRKGCYEEEGRRKEGRKERTKEEKIERVESERQKRI